MYGLYIRTIQVYRIKSITGERTAGNNAPRIRDRAVLAGRAHFI